MDLIEYMIKMTWNRFDFSDPEFVLGVNLQMVSFIELITNNWVKG